MYPDGTKGNPCDCGWKNPHSDKDIVIAINALSNNEGYNNFFCYANVQQASFGADSGNLNDGVRTSIPTSSVACDVWDRFDRLFACKGV